MDLLFKVKHLSVQLHHPVFKYMRLMISSCDDDDDDDANVMIPAQRNLLVFSEADLSLRQEGCVHCILQQCS